MHIKIIEGSGPQDVATKADEAMQNLRGVKDARLTIQETNLGNFRFFVTILYVEEGKRRAW